MDGPLHPLAGIPVEIDNRAPVNMVVALNGFEYPATMVSDAPRGAVRLVVHVEVWWRLAFPEEPWWVRFAIELRHRTMARLHGA